MEAQTSLTETVRQENKTAQNLLGKQVAGWCNVLYDDNSNDQTVDGNDTRHDDGNDRLHDQLWFHDSHG